MLKALSLKFPECELHGFDISPEAVKQARVNLPKGNFQVADMFMELPYKKEFDLVITNAVLIYADTDRIESVLREIKRVGKSFIFVEFNADKDQVVDGYYVYNYPKLLEEIGFKNIKIEKITNWEESNWKEFGTIITAEK